MLTLNDGRSQLWQWDTKRKLTVDADCSQVHFSNKVFGRSIDVDVVDGVASIPDILLQTDKDLSAWAFVGTPENGYTKISKVFKVNKRNKPADYVFTPPEQTTLSEIMKRIDDLESIQDPDAIKNAVDDYLANNPIKVYETDPTVPEWAKEREKPKYTADEVGALSKTELSGAVNEALAQAKASGEFDGKTPVKGVDYFTEEEKQEIAEQAAELVDVPKIDLSEYVKTVNGNAPDENGNVEIEADGSGITSTEKNLMLALFKAIPYTSDVSATMKSLEAIWNSGGGGDTPDIPDVPTVTYYSVAYNLTNITADNSASSIIEGGSLTVNLTPDTNAVMGEVIVTMGGVDVTATAYSNGKISISSVTGDVVITATATVANYTQVEYLEGDGYAFIYVPYGIGATDLVEANFYLVESQWSCVWDSYDGNRHAFRIRKGSNYIGLTRQKADAWSDYATGVSDFTYPTTPCKVKFVETEAGKGTLYDADGNVLYENLEDADASTFTGTSQIVIFGKTTNGTNASEPTAGLRICEFIIRDVYGATVRHFIPVLDADGTPAMYEKVSGEYFYNASTAEGSAFIAGGAV